MKITITTIAFDYGRVLAYPSTGNWFVTEKTSDILGVHTFSSMMSNKESTYSALQKACDYLNENHLLLSESEEIEQFTHFYKLFLSYINIERPIAVCRELAIDIVCNDNKVSFYDDSCEGIKMLSKKYKIAIISDTWPSLRRILTNKGITNMLTGLFMSCDYNATKATPKIFQIALDELNEQPNNVAFVDDSISNLQCAEKVGMFPILMDRSDIYQSSSYSIAKNINDVEKIIGGLV